MRYHSPLNSGGKGHISPIKDLLKDEQQGNHCFSLVYNELPTNSPPTLSARRFFEVEVGNGAGVTLESALIVHSHFFAAFLPLEIFNK